MTLNNLFSGGRAPLRHRLKRLLGAVEIGLLTVSALLPLEQAYAQAGRAEPRARIWCRSEMRVAPMKVDVEDQVSRVISGQRQEGLPEWALKDNEKVYRTIFEKNQQGYTQRLVYVFWYAGKRFGDEEKGTLMANGVPYNRTIVFDGRDTYAVTDNGVDRSRSPKLLKASSRADINAGLPAESVRCGWGRWCYFRNNPEIERVMANPHTRRVEGTTLTEITGDLPSAEPYVKESSPGRMRVLRDSRYGGQVVTIEVTMAIDGDGIFRRVLATDFRRRPDGEWFPYKVVEQSLSPRGAGKGRVVQEQSFHVTKAFFGDLANVKEILPPVLSTLSVADRRFKHPISYKVSTRWLSRAESEDRHRNYLADIAAAEQSRNSSRASNYVLGGIGVLLMAGGIGVLSHRWLQERVHHRRSQA